MPNAADVTVLEEYLDATSAELGARARTRRDALFGRVATYSPKVFIPLTELCRDRCGYCTFAKAPAKLAAPYLSIEEVVAIATRGEPSRRIDSETLISQASASIAASTGSKPESLSTSSTRNRVEVNVSR